MSNIAYHTICIKMIYAFCHNNWSLQEITYLTDIITAGVQKLDCLVTRNRKCMAPVALRQYTLSKSSTSLQLANVFIDFLGKIFDKYPSGRSNNISREAHFSG